MRSILLLIVLCVCSVVNAQVVFKQRNLQVTVNKTTNLIFPASIASVDRGAEHILVQKSMSNILRVKADTAFADTTSLSVITSDGKLYSFLVCFVLSPIELNIDLGAGEVVTRDTALTRIADTVVKMKSNLYGLSYSNGQVKMSVAGIYVCADKLVCKVRIENNSSLTYETGKFRIHVTAKNLGKRKAIQETEIMPLLVSPDETIVRERQSAVLSIVLPKIAVGSNKVLQIDAREKNGERHLSLRLPNKFILNATLIK
jgi:conjugative transposon TraN protein